MNPTKEQIAEARASIEAWLRAEPPSMKRIFEALDILLAATASDPGPPRPDDMAELARLVARELRSLRGIRAKCSEIDQSYVRIEHQYKVSVYSMYDSQFDNLRPREIADVIQQEEATKAEEWAGDE